MPRKVFVAGEILTAADVNTNLMDQSVMVFDDATARTTAIPTPVEGMVTYLKDTNLVQAFTGSAFTAVGGILQVVSTTKTDAFSTASTTFEDVTGLEVTVTPTSTTSKIFIVVNLLTANNTTNRNPLVNLVRDSTNIAQSTGGGSRNQTLTSFVADSSRIMSEGVSFLDSPATTSEIIYKIQIANVASGTTFVNRSVTGGDGSVSTITVMEVAG